MRSIYNICPSRYFVFFPPGSSGAIDAYLFGIRKSTGDGSTPGRFRIHATLSWNIVRVDTKTRVEPLLSSEPTCCARPFSWRTQCRFRIRVEQWRYENPAIIKRGISKTRDVRVPTQSRTNNIVYCPVFIADPCNKRKPWKMRCKGKFKKKKKTDRPSPYRTNLYKYFINNIADKIGTAQARP